MNGMQDFVFGAQVAKQATFHLYGFPPGNDRNTSQHLNPLSRVLTALAVVVIAGGEYLPRATKENSVLVSWACERLRQSSSM